MIYLDNNECLTFQLAKRGEEDDPVTFRLTFQRTLRVPDDGRENFLPPNLGHFPLELVEDFRTVLPKDWVRKGGILLPMYTQEAMWMSFDADSPVAVKIGVGKRCALTGRAWEEGLTQGESMTLTGETTSLQNYVTVPEQPWLDGFCVEPGVVRQFVAVPRHQGLSVEEQLTGRDDVAGIQIEVIPLKERALRKLARQHDIHRLEVMYYDCCESVNLGAGGRIKQSIYRDEVFDVDDYDFTRFERVFVHLVNAKDWKGLTGLEPPTPVVTAQTYTAMGLPWFDYESDTESVAGGVELGSIQSVGELIPEIALKDKAVSEPTTILEGLTGRTLKAPTEFFQSGRIVKRERNVDEDGDEDEEA